MRKSGGGAFGPGARNSGVPLTSPRVYPWVADDVVYAHSHLYFSTNVAALLARFDDTPLVITNHGLHSQTAPMAVQTLYRPVARLTFNAADRVLCYTETDRDRLRERGVTAPISVIHNGIDCETFVPDAGTENRSRVLFVGWLKKTKGVRELLEAFGDVATEVPDATLTFVGEGPLREELEQRAIDRGLADRVEFTGRVPNDELPCVYAESTVFALPSTAEGFPRTVLEALACGTPVVTSDLPQLEGVVNRVGETVPPDGVDGLTKVLRELLTDDVRRCTLGAQGRDPVVKTTPGPRSYEKRPPPTTSYSNSDPENV
jgi:glycosyltransferase involved in cell wall biosynthesis